MRPRLKVEESRGKSAAPIRIGSTFIVWKILFMLFILGLATVVVIFVHSRLFRGDPLEKESIKATSFAEQLADIKLWPANNYNVSKALFSIPSRFNSTLSETHRNGHNDVIFISPWAPLVNQLPKVSHWEGVHFDTRHKKIVKRIKVRLHRDVPGCNGNYLEASKNGDIMGIRYTIKDTNENNVIDEFPENWPRSFPVQLERLHTQSDRRSHLFYFQLGSFQVVPGLDYTLHNTCEGQVIEAQIPWELAYGNDGFHSLIPPKTDLHYLIHVVQIQRAYSEEFSTARDDLLASIISTVVAHRGESCDSICASFNKTCIDYAFKIINNCPRLREHFSCIYCEIAAKGTAGKDMPCWVAPNAPASHPRGFCMVHPDPQASTCDAFYLHTSRLCPCVFESDLESI